MQIAILFIDIISFLGLLAVVIFIRMYIPSYVSKKGENLATKEDIAEITNKTEEAQRKFRESFELFSSDVKFKYDFFYKQYSELYCKLYSIIIQSEYIRCFYAKSSGKNLIFDDAPFLEVQPTKKLSQRIDYSVGTEPHFTTSEVSFKTPISEFNKLRMCDLIIENGALASQQLLKIAVSYRFAQMYYSGNPENKNSSVHKSADIEELRLIREMVCCIVTEYNKLRKELKMSYDEGEIKNGILLL